MSDCQCPACAALAARYEGDPELLKFYRKKLLIQGWAGKVDEVEHAYQKAHGGAWSNRTAPSGFQSRRIGA